MNRSISKALVAVVIALIAADWLSKLWIIKRMALGETLALIADFVVERDR